MAETQDASVGYMGEVHLDGYELQQVKSFGLPPKERDRVEKTHLKSGNGNWTREYLMTFYQDREFQVVLNFRPLSDTNTKLDDAVADGETHTCKLVLPENGVPVAQIECTVKVTAKDDGEVTGDGVMESTSTFLVETIEAVEAYVA